MYADQVTLWEFSNREDFIVSLGLWDDLSYDPVSNSYQPIALSGTATAGSMQFTGSSWNVAIGTLLTTSVTPITIPVFPIGNQLSALSLTVATSLTITPGSLVTISDPTGQNTMTGVVTSYTSSTGALVCQIGMTFQFEIRVSGPLLNQSGYVPWYDFGSYPDYGPLISASLGNGILITDIGVITITIPESQFRTLGNIGTANAPMDWGGTYRIGLTCTDGIGTRQILRARLPVVSGGVTN